ncbi:hypothetical protein, partial [Mesorhizobium sp. M1C.F.Ca.ET.212.01.1.1]|uniref:hypothetical protein n=1 Tax=Mesorhizobium sp. M1C.F.Ca.ET.212.01.1.1 TaxID=2500527 RepID=UPI001FE1CF9F
MPLLPPLIRHLKSPDLFGSLDRLPALGKPVSERTFVVLTHRQAKCWQSFPTWASRRHALRSIEH